MIRAEVDQQLACGNYELTLDAYFAIIFGKTASLFKAIGQIACALAPQTTPQLTIALEKLGMAFQITDDSLDYFSPTQTLGKEAARDLAENKMTLPLVLAFAAGTTEQKHLLQTHLIAAQDNADDLMTHHQAIVEVLNTLDIEKKVKAIAQQFCQHAQQALTGCPDCEAKTQFEYEVNAKKAGTYLLTAKVVTNKHSQYLSVSANNSGLRSIELPFTLGAWQDTKAIRVKLKQGKNTLKFMRIQPPQKGVVVKSFTLKPM